MQRIKDPSNLHENWSETKEKLKNKFALLTNRDVLLIEGRMDEMMRRIESKLGKTKDEVRELITQLE